jgi:transcription initiation factor IIF auxiliary subunit
MQNSSPTPSLGKRRGEKPPLCGKERGWGEFFLDSFGEIEYI